VAMLLVVVLLVVVVMVVVVAGPLPSPSSLTWYFDRGGFPRSNAPLCSHAAAPLPTLACLRCDETATRTRPQVSC
jgi:hypothetical protein